MTKPAAFPMVCSYQDGPVCRYNISSTRPSIPISPPPFINAPYIPPHVDPHHMARPVSRRCWPLPRQPGLDQEAACPLPSWPQGPPFSGQHRRHALRQALAHVCRVGPEIWYAAIFSDSPWLTRFPRRHHPCRGARPTHLCVEQCQCCGGHARQKELHLLGSPGPSDGWRACRLEAHPRSPSLWRPFP